MQRTAIHLTSRDWLATILVLAGALVYALWLAGIGSQDVAEVRLVTSILLVLGFVASASAVVPGFDALLHGPRLYLAGTSLLGLGALMSGIVALVTGDEVALAVLIATTVVLWAISTIRHTVAGSVQRSADRHTQRGSPITG